MKRLYIALLVFATLFAFVLPSAVSAQTATPEPVEDAPVVVDIVEPGNGQVLLDAWQVVVGVVSAVLAGGIVGIGGVIVLVNRIRSDATTMAAVERLGDSVPRETAEQLIAVLASLREIIDFGIDIIDGEDDAVPPFAQG